jgi:hypothetical protein
MTRQDEEDTIIYQAVGRALNDFDQATGLSEDLYIIKADDHDAFCMAVIDGVRRGEDRSDE